MKVSPGRILTGVLLVVAGIVVGIVASGTISVDEDAVHAPNWILALLGLLFAGGGLATLVDPRTSLARWSAGTVVTTITVVSAWVSLFGSSEHFSGDWPFLSDDANVLVSRIVFGCVSLLGLAMIVAAAKKSWIKEDG